MHTDAQRNGCLTAARRRLSRLPRRLEHREDWPNYIRQVELWARGLASDTRPLIPSDLASTMDCPKPGRRIDHFAEHGPDEATAAWWVLMLHRLLVERLAPSPDSPTELAIAALARMTRPGLGDSLTVDAGDAGGLDVRLCGWVIEPDDEAAPDGRVVVRKGEPGCRCSMLSSLFIRNTKLSTRRIIESATAEISRKPRGQTILAMHGVEPSDRNIRLMRTRTAFEEAHGNVAAAHKALLADGENLGLSTVYNHLTALDRLTPHWRDRFQLSNQVGNLENGHIVRTLGKTRGIMR